MGMDATSAVDNMMMLIMMRTMRGSRRRGGQATRQQGRKAGWIQRQCAGESQERRGTSQACIRAQTKDWMRTQHVAVGPLWQGESDDADADATTTTG